VYLYFEKLNLLKTKRVGKLEKEEYKWK